jgi:hypothetical protein
MRRPSLPGTLTSLSLDLLASVSLFVSLLLYFSRSLVAHLEANEEILMQTFLGHIFYAVR